MTKTTKRVRDLGAEMLVHGTDEALRWLASRYTADEILAAAAWAAARRAQ